VNSREPRGWLACLNVRKRWSVVGVAFLAFVAGVGAGPVAGTAASDTCPGFSGSTSMLKSRGPSAPAVLVDATAGVQRCLDAVTLTFRSLGNGTPPPRYTVRYQDPAREPFLDGDPPSPISLPGAAFLVVRVRPTSSVDPFAADAPPTYTGNLSLDYGDHHHLQIVRELPDAKGAVVWAIGLDGVRPFRVDRAQNPPRVTVLIG